MRQLHIGCIGRNIPDKTQAPGHSPVNSQIPIDVFRAFGPCSEYVVSKATMVFSRGCSKMQQDFKLQFLYTLHSRAFLQSAQDDAALHIAATPLHTTHENMLGLAFFRLYSSSYCDSLVPCRSMPCPRWELTCKKPVISTNTVQQSTKSTRS